MDSWRDGEGCAEQGGREASDRGALLSSLPGSGGLRHSVNPCSLVPFLAFLLLLLVNSHNTKHTVLTTFNCTCQWHQVPSHCCATFVHACVLSCV